MKATDIEKLIKPKKSGIPILEYTVVRDGIKRATDLEIYAESLASTVEPDGVYWHGEAISGYCVDDYPGNAWKFDTSSTRRLELNEADCEAIKTAAEFVIKAESLRPVMQHVAVIIQNDELIISGTDTHQIYLYRRPYWHSNLHLLLPLRVAKIMPETWGDIDYSDKRPKNDDGTDPDELLTHFDDGHDDFSFYRPENISVVVKASDTTVSWMLWTKNFDGQPFPNAVRVIPTLNGEVEYRIDDPVALLKLLASWRPLINKITKQINIELGGNSLKFSFENMEMGVEKSAVIKTSIQTAAAVTNPVIYLMGIRLSDDVDVTTHRGFNIDLFIHCLKVAAGGAVTFTGTSAGFASALFR